MVTPHHFLVLIGLGIIWTLLSGHYSGLLLTLGVVSCLISYGFYRKIVGQAQTTTIRFHPLNQIKYTFWLMYEIVKTNLDVIAAIFNPGKIAPQFFKVNTTGLDEMGRVIYANSITRTPGTVSVRLYDDEIEVHGLLEKSKVGLMDDVMKNKIRDLHISD